MNDPYLVYLHWKVPLKVFPRTVLTRDYERLVELDSSLLAMHEHRISSLKLQLADMEEKEKETQVKKLKEMADTASTTLPDDND